MDIDTYKRIVVANGSNVANAYTNATIAKINDSFADSPFYASIPINGTLTDVRIVESDEKDPDKKTLLFRPNSTVNRGSVATIGVYKWMLVDFNDNAIFPKSNIWRCTDIFKWKDKNGNVKQYDVVSSLISDREITLKTDKILDTPYNKISVLAPYNSDTASVKMMQRFIFKNFVYMVIGKDDMSKVYGDTGYINFVLQLTELNANDDFVNQIADNTVVYGASDTGSTNTGGVAGQEW